jgi:DNA-binding beta-propeller fold protein YncE
MKKIAVILFFQFFFLASHSQQIITPGKKASTILLPNGWSLSPAGSSIPLGDLPLNMAVSASKQFIAVTNNGYSDQSIELIDVAKGKLLDSIRIPKSWYGLKFTNDRFLYASGGNDNVVWKYEIINRKLKVADSISLGRKWPVAISPSGLDVDDNRQLLYVVTKENNSLYVVDLKNRKQRKTFNLSGEAYSCVLSPDRKLLYISCWGCDQVKIFDTNKQMITDSIKVGDNPNEIVLSRNGKWLFVTNANDNSVSVVNTISRKEVEVLNTALYPNSPAGSTPNGLALSGDEKTLYVANADNNCLTVFDISTPGKSKGEGFIPTGWYPTNVKVIASKIYVTNGKGFTSYANPFGPAPVLRNEEVVYQGGDLKRPRKVQYIGGLMRATLSIIKVPGAGQLKQYTEQVYRNTPYNKKDEMASTSVKGNAIPSRVGEKSPIKHVFYIIKENRTFDQVLSDIPGANGDTSLLLFGERATPNQHAIAKQFVLLDNFYANAEVSADGHNWSLGGYATDFLEKTWPTSYGGRGGRYDAEGNREIANNKNGFIWDFCKRAGVSYRTYGEFADDGKPNIPGLAGHLCPYFTGWDMTVRDTTRFYQWKREFDSLVAVNKVPQLNTLRFPNDHTEGLRKGRPTPFAHVADNDLAVGMFIEHLSQSPIWKESVVFIVEDDAQNGPDHIDAHRTTAYIAGGYIKRGFIDHTMYTTTSMLRTMELILGIPPMTQYDASATPMWRCFSETPNSSVFRSLPENIDLGQRTMALGKWQKASENFNLTKEDAIPDMEFNKVLWYGIKGDQVAMPSPRRAAFVSPKDQDAD